MYQNVASGNCQEIVEEPSGDGREIIGEPSDIPCTGSWIHPTQIPEEIHDVLLLITIQLTVYEHWCVPKTTSRNRAKAQNAKKKTPIFLRSIFLARHFFFLRVETNDKSATSMRHMLYGASIVFTLRSCRIGWYGGLSSVAIPSVTMSNTWGEVPESSEKYRNYSLVWLVTSRYASSLLLLRSEAIEAAVHISDTEKSRFAWLRPFAIRPRCLALFQP